jgi:hypothetical protein
VKFVYRRYWVKDSVKAFENRRYMKNFNEFKTGGFKNSFNRL